MYSTKQYRYLDKLLPEESILSLKSLRGIKTMSQNADATIRSLLIGHEWLICCSASNPDDMCTYILETVCRYDDTGLFAKKIGKPVFIEYGISQSVGGQYPYRLHDSLMMPIQNDKDFDDLVRSIIEVFDVVIIEDNMVDREKIYGKIGTKYENKIVSNKK